MQDIWKLEKHCIWSGIVYSDHNSITSQDFYMGSKRSKSDYLSVSRQFVDLANFVYSLFNRKGSDGEMGRVGPPLSSTDPNNIGPNMENYLLCIIV